MATSTTGPKGHTRRKALLLAGVAVGIGLTGLGVYLFVDSSLPEDADLVLDEARIPDAQNGYVLFEAGTEEPYWPETEAAEESDEEGELAGDEAEPADEEPAMEPEDEEPEPKAASSGEIAADILRGTLRDPEVAAQLVERNRELLERFDRSLALPGFQLPLPGASDERTYRKPFRWRAAPDLAFVRAWASVNAGDSASAAASALSAVRFGERLERAARTAIDFMVGTSLRTLAYHRLEILAPHLKLEPAAWRKWLEAFARLAPGAESARLAIQGEYAFVKQGITKTSADGLPETDLDLFDVGHPAGPWRHRIFLLPNETLELVSRAARTALGAFPDSGRWRPPDWSPFEEAKVTRTLFPGRNGVGRAGAMGVIGAYGMVIERHQAAWYRHHLLHAALALHAFEATGERPAASLEELIPEWLPSIPADPASGAPLRHDPARRLLWFVGLDGVDGVDDPDALPDDDHDTRQEYLAQPGLRLPHRAEEPK